MDHSFRKQQKINFDRYQCLMRKHFTNDSVENFTRSFKEIADNFINWEDREDSIVRHVLLTKLLDNEIQKQLHHEVVEQKRPLCTGTRIKMGNSY